MTDVMFGKEYIVKVTDDGECITVGELIKCKDCKYAKKIYIKNLPWLKQWEYSCRYFSTHSVMGDGFCSCAERKEE